MESPANTIWAWPWSAELLTDPQTHELNKWSLFNATKFGSGLLYNNSHLLKLEELNSQQIGWWKGIRGIAKLEKLESESYEEKQESESQRPEETFQGEGSGPQARWGIRERQLLRTTKIIIKTQFGNEHTNKNSKYEFPINSRKFSSYFCLNTHPYTTIYLSGRRI